MRTQQTQPQQLQHFEQTIPISPNRRLQQTPTTIIQNSPPIGGNRLAQNQQQQQSYHSQLQQMRSSFPPSQSSQNTQIQQQPYSNNSQPQQNSQTLLHQQPQTQQQSQAIPITHQSIPLRPSNGAQRVPSIQQQQQQQQQQPGQQQSIIRQQQQYQQQIQQIPFYRGSFQQGNRIIHQQQYYNYAIPQNSRFSFPVSMQVNIHFDPRPEGLDINNLKEVDNFKNFLENFADKDNYLCQICQNLLWDSTSCSKCHKNFCLECLGYWLQSKNTCPCCRERFEMKKADNSIVQNLNRLEFKCPFENCEATPNYEFFLKHTQSCDFAELKCKNEGCDFQEIRKNYGNHEQECPHFLMPCKWCRKQVKRAEIEQHQETCDQKIIKCENEGCEQKLPKARMTSHLEQCGFKLEMCQQCKKEYKHKDLGAHRQECEFNEISCRGCAILVYKKDIDSHEDECPEIQMTCSDCQFQYKRKDQEGHSELQCSKMHNAALENQVVLQEEQIKSLQNENQLIHKQMDQMKQCMANLYEIVHNQLQCQCSSIGDQNCLLNLPNSSNQNNQK